MENKENYYKTLTDLSSTIDYDIFYEDLISTNVISVNDTNELLSSINFCIDTLTAICTDEFCQLCENTYDYYISLTDNIFPRVKYYNEKTLAISAVYSASKINGIELSSTPVPPIDLLTYPKNETYSIVSSINGHTGEISGVEKIIINGESFQWSLTNNGRLNLGNFKTTMGDYLISVNGKNGVIDGMPTGVKYNNIVKSCDQTGLVDISNLFSKYITIYNPNFTNLYVREVYLNNEKSVINKRYITDHKNPFKILSLIVTIDSVEDNYIALDIPSIQDDVNFLSYIYGLQNNQCKRISGYIPGITVKSFELHYYDKGIPLTFILDSNEVSATIKLIKRGNPATVTLKYSKNYAPYTAFNGQVDINRGDVIAFSGANETFSLASNQFYYFEVKKGTTNAKFVCYGNVMSLVNWDTEIKNDYQFHGLFLSTDIMKAPLLPATKLALSCYGYMFHQCNSLIVPPQLPAMTMAPLCYQNMFNTCSSLSSVPILPAKDLAPSCYYGMFVGCTALTQLPYYLLPATELKDWCYTSMFVGCTSLMDGPLLPAPIPAYNSDGTCALNYVNCYGNMFYQSPLLSAVHVNCTPGLLLQHWAPPEYESNHTEELCKAWMMDYKATHGDNAAVEWIQTHNYTNEWLYNYIGQDGVPNNDHANVVIYNTALWNEMKTTTNVEKFYYSYPGQFNFNYYNIVSAARSLEDTPFSIEITDVIKNSNNESKGKICWRSCRKIFTNNVVEIKRHSFTHHYPSGTEYIATMNPKFKYYDPSRNLGYDWTQCSSLFQHGVDDAGYNITRVCEKFPFQDGKYIKKNAIVSLSSNCFSMGMISGDLETGVQQFWQIALHWGARAKVLGNIRSLVGGRDTIRPFEFYGMFKNSLIPRADSTLSTSKILDFHQLVLPAQNLGYKCYADMFDACIVTANVKAPLDLPATNLADKCYDRMFHACTALVVAPTIYGSKHEFADCYHMFSGCTKLSIPPTFNTFEYTSSNSFEGMFEGCTSLTYSFDLKVDKVDWRAYASMFQWCTSLVIPPSLNSKEINVQGCEQMFLNCNKILYIPPLPPATLSLSCYKSMFSGCANSYMCPHIYLPAKTLAPSCYYLLLTNTHVNNIVVKFSNWNVQDSTYMWLNVKPSSGKFYCYSTLPHTQTLLQRSPSNIPNGWNVYINQNGSKLVFKDTITTGDMKIFYLTK